MTPGAKFRDLKMALLDLRSWMTPRARFRDPKMAFLELRDCDDTP